MEKERNDQVIFVKDLLFAALYQWRWIIAAALVFAIILGGAVGFSQFKNASNTASAEAVQAAMDSYENEKLLLEKKVEDAQKMVESQEEYNLESAVMALDPYGPYQRPNGVLGAVTTFTYKALKNVPITLYGDGSVVRDFIYIDDAVRGILQIAEGNSPHKTFNLGSGQGTSIIQVLEIIENTLGLPLNISHLPSRQVDVPTNYLDISRYEQAYGPLSPVSLEEGILKTAEFMRKTGLV